VKIPVRKKNPGKWVKREGWVSHTNRDINLGMEGLRLQLIRVGSAPSDEGAARVGARRAGTDSSVLIVGRLLFVWDLESNH
jgi:hypothetical protein